MYVWKSLSRVQLFATPWTIACHTPLSIGFSRQEYWSGLPFPSPGDLPDPETEATSPVSLHCRQILYHLKHQGKARHKHGFWLQVRATDHYTFLTPCYFNWTLWFQSAIGEFCMLMVQWTLINTIIITIIITAYLSIFLIIRTFYLKVPHKLLSPCAESNSPDWKLSHSCHKK